MSDRAPEIPSGIWLATTGAGLTFQRTRSFLSAASAEKHLMDYKDQHETLGYGNLKLSGYHLKGVDLKGNNVILGERKFVPLE